MDAFSSVFSDPFLSKLLAPVAAIGGVLILLVIFWRRADSLHAIWERVWRLLAGSSEVQEQRLRTFMQQMRDLEKFRLVYGLKVTNLSDMNKLIAWVQRYDLDMTSLQKARRWADFSKPDIMQQPPKGFLTLYRAGLLLAAAFAASIVFAAGSPAILRMKDSGIWFTSNGVTVDHVFFGSGIKLDQCSKNATEIQASFEFKESEIKALCDAHANGSLREMASNVMADQRRLCGFFGMLAAVWILLASVGIRSVTAARDVLQSIARQRKAPQAQT